MENKVEIKTLQIFDWIGGTKYEVGTNTGTFSRFQCGKIDIHRPNSIEDLYGDDRFFLETIPLTKEMLEKNGFQLRHISTEMEDKYYYVLDAYDLDEDSEGCFAINYSEDSVEFDPYPDGSEHIETTIEFGYNEWSVKIETVDQLQRIMRIYHFDKEANNFQI